MKKRVISLLLSVMFVMMLIPFTAIISSAATATRYYAELTIPIRKYVESPFGNDPGKQTFEFEIVDPGANMEFDILNSSLTTEGLGEFFGEIRIGLYSQDSYYNLTEGITIREKPIESKYWYSDPTEYRVIPYMEDLHYGTQTFTVVRWGIYNLTVGDVPNYSDPSDGAKELVFNNYYYGADTNEEYFYVLDVPVYKWVESADGSDPGTHTFTIEVADSFSAANFDIIDNTVTSTGTGGYFEGHFTIGIPSEDEFWNLSEGFVVREKDTGDDNWTFDTTEYYIAPYMERQIIVGRTVIDVPSYAIYNKTEGQVIDYDYHMSSLDGVYFRNKYELPKKDYVALTYDPNGGSVQNPNHIYRFGETAVLDETAFREGYTFTGWYDKPAGGTQLTSVYMNSDKTVYAGWEKTSVPPMLNGDDHSAYVKGYPDGTVKPGKNITRAEVTMIFYRLLKPEVRSAYHATTNQFTDVKSSDWFNEAVSTMANLGIIKGRNETTFAPDAPITRAEYATICARFDNSIITEHALFNDISDHWAKSYIMRAAAIGWIRGYTDGSFKPNQQITRAESITLTNRVLQRLPQSHNDLLTGMISFPDNSDITSWYYLPIQEATNSHDYVIETDGREVWTAIRETTMP